jgi:hypothetical protein
MNASRALLALCTAALLALTACSKPNPIGGDLQRLNAAGEAAMTALNPQAAVIRARSATNEADRAAALREAANGFRQIQAKLSAERMETKEVTALQARMSSAFEKSGAAAESAAVALEKKDAAGMNASATQLTEAQREILATAQEMTKLAKEHKISLKASK